MKIAEATLAPGRARRRLGPDGALKAPQQPQPYVYATPRAMEIEHTNPAFWLSVGQIDPDRHPAWRGHRGGDRAGLPKNAARAAPHGHPVGRGRRSGGALLGWIASGMLQAHVPVMLVQ